MITVPKVKRELQRRLDALMADQQGKFGDWPWSDRELELVDQAGAAVDAAIQAGDSQAFNGAVAVWLRRTTPLPVLSEGIGKGSGKAEAARWVGVYREEVERGVKPARFVVKGCKGLGGADLVVVVGGANAPGTSTSGTPAADPKLGEFRIEDLPGILDVAEASARAGRADHVLPDGLAAGLGMLRGAFGPGTEIVSVRAEG